MGLPRRRRNRGSAGAAALLAGLALTGCGAVDRGAPPEAPAATPRAFEPAGGAGERSGASRAEPPRHLMAALKRRTPLRARPRGKVLHRLGTRTEFGSGTVLGVIERRRRWLKVAASQLPNGRRGWIHASRASLGGTDLDVRVDRSEHRGTLRHDGKAILRFPVAVGRPGNETPLGRYAITDKLTTTSASSPYGCCAIALTGHQTRLEPGWPGGDRLAIHGTTAPETIGTAASLGCLRAHERHLRRLMHRLPLGAPVVIRA